MKPRFHALLLWIAPLAIGLFCTPAAADDSFYDVAHDRSNGEHHNALAEGVHAGFTPRDLKGEYLCTLQDVRQSEVSLLEVCVAAGTLTFDGAGSGTLIGNMRCSNSGSAPSIVNLSYTVNADGSFLFNAAPGAANPNPFHGQIVDHGHTLLVDGTTNPVPAESAGWIGICMTR